MPCFLCGFHLVFVCFFIFCQGFLLSELFVSKDTIYIEFGGDDFCYPSGSTKMAIAGKSPRGIDTSSTRFFRS